MEIPSSTNAPGTWHAGSAGAASRCQSPCYTPPFAPPSFDLIPSRKKIEEEKRKEPSGVARREPFPRFPSKQRQPSLLRGFTGPSITNSLHKLHLSYRFPSPFPAASPLLLDLNLSLSQISPARLHRLTAPCHHICHLQSAICNLHSAFCSLSTVPVASWQQIAQAWSPNRRITPFPCIRCPP